MNSRLCVLGWGWGHILSCERIDIVKLLLVLFFPGKGFTDFKSDKFRHPFHTIAWLNKASNLLRMSLGSGGGNFVCLWRCRMLSVPLEEGRPQEGGEIAQAWVTWPEGASVPNYK